LSRDFHALHCATLNGDEFLPSHNGWCVSYLVGQMSKITLVNEQSLMATVNQSHTFISEIVAVGGLSFVPKPIRPHPGFFVSIAITALPLLSCHITTTSEPASEICTGR
jgi:hypothetical protein